ncbi:MAG: hypothetical protein V4481_00535 [Patescibacteria group bacterium]
MNEQERSVPIAPEQVVPPAQENPPRKSKATILVILVILLLLLVGGWYFFSQRKISSTPVKDSVTPIVFDDSDLKVSYPEPSLISENSAPAFSAVNSSLVTSADMTILTKYIASSTPTSIPPVTQANKILSAYPILVKTFDENATKPYQCNMGKGESCSLNAVRGITYLAATRALISFRQNKIADAQKTASSIVSLGKNITANADAEITLLVGWITQKTGYSVLSIINSKNKTPLFSEVEKNALITQLRNEQKKVFQYSYTRAAEGIDYITSPDKKLVNQAMSTDEEAIVNEYRKTIAENPNAWNPTETKKYFYDSYKIMISNIDLPCGANLPESKIEMGFNPGDQKTENYIGKTLYSSAYAGLNSLSTKRCEVEAVIKNL